MVKWSHLLFLLSGWQFMPAAEHIHFVTGKLAEPALRAVVEEIARKQGFHFSIACLPISVAALMTARWTLRHLEIPEEATKVVFPGYLQSGLDEIRSVLSIPAFCGPKDLRELPEYFGLQNHTTNEYGGYTIEILAEINHANRLTIEELEAQAIQLKEDGADIIDIGCEPGFPWGQVGEAIQRLRDRGLRLSIDSFDPTEVQAAVDHGAELVLSVNRMNREASIAWGVEVVVIPDDTSDYQRSLEESIEFLEVNRVPYRIDPILEPIGLGFSDSLERFRWVRHQFPKAKMMMGIGNLTEMTDVDSAGVNTILLGICEELQIESVLSTQVIPWARSSIRECDVARRLVAYAVRHRVPPKRVDSRLVMLRDPKLKHFPPEHFQHLEKAIKDNNYRILIDRESIHLLSAGVHIVGKDPFEMMAALLELPAAENVDPSHAFYLGYELAKAKTALQLGKNYEQDESLRWGFLTVEDQHHRLPRRQRKIHE